MPGSGVRWTYGRTDYTNEHLFSNLKRLTPPPVSTRTRKDISSHASSSHFPVANTNSTVATSTIATNNQSGVERLGGGGGGDGNGHEGLMFHRSLKQVSLSYLHPAFCWERRASTSARSFTTRILRRRRSIKDMV